MKLSKETQSILKSFSGVNTGIVVEAGNKLMVESELRDIFVKASVPETFPIQFAIYDVPSFTNTLTLFEDSDLTFEVDYVNIKQDRNQCDYYYTDPSFIAHGDWLEIDDSAYVLEFDLSNDDINNIQKAAAALGLDQLEFKNDAGTIMCDVVSKSGDSKNRYGVDVGSCDASADFNVIMRVGENFRFYPGDYSIRIADIQGTLVFCADNKDTDIKYQIAMDRNSYYK